MKVEFFIPCEPPTVTLQQKKVRVIQGKPFFYEGANLKKARRNFMLALSLTRPEKPFRGAVRLVTAWFFPHGKQHQPNNWKTTRPDTDNMIKLLKDCMTRSGYWMDDSLICSEITEKYWSAHPGIYVQINDIEEEKIFDRITQMYQ